MTQPLAGEGQREGEIFPSSFIFSLPTMNVRFALRLEQSLPIAFPNDISTRRGDYAQNMKEHADRRSMMKKGVFCLFAALLVVGLPLGALAGTQVFKAKDMDVDYWEICPYSGASSSEWPAGPAQEFEKDLLIHYVGTEKFNARMKSADVGWNRNVHGTSYIYDYNEVVSGGGNVMMSAMSAVPKLNFTTSAGTVQSMYPFSCMPLSYTGLPVPDVTAFVPLYAGPFQVEEVLQDDGGDFGCYVPGSQTAVNFQDCYGRGYFADLTKVDYLMLHVKITGNKIYFWKATIHQPGILQIEDKRGFNAIWTYPLQ
jgi:hypothetical protein